MAKYHKPSGLNTYQASTAKWFRNAGKKVDGFPNAEIRQPLKNNVIIKTLNTIPLFEMSDFLNGLISIFLNNLNCPTNQKLKITVDAHLAEKD